jgi:phosphinothricin acetyltransferase
MSSDTVGVRLATAEDAEAVRSVYAPVVKSSAISFEITPPTTTEMNERITTTLRTYPWLVAVDDADGEVTGFAHAAEHRSRPAYQWSVDVSVYVGSDARGGGVGRLLYRALLEILERQGFTSAFAGIALPNPASVRLHRAMGFRPIGVYRSVGYKLGAWHDVAWWQHPLGSRPHKPTEPLPLPTLLAAGELDDVLSR